MQLLRRPPCTNAAGACAGSAHWVRSHPMHDARNLSPKTHSPCSRACVTVCIVRWYCDMRACVGCAASKCSICLRLPLRKTTTPACMCAPRAVAQPCLRATIHAAWCGTVSCARSCMQVDALCHGSRRRVIGGSSGAGREAFACEARECAQCCRQCRRRQRRRRAVTRNGGGECERGLRIAEWRSDGSGGWRWRR